MSDDNPQAESDKKPGRKRKNATPPEVRLSAPWGAESPQYIINRQSDVFVEQRTRVHERFILEQAKTRRLALILAAILILAACAVVLFAPPGRETISYWIGAALLIFAAGASG